MMIPHATTYEPASSIGSVEATACVPIAQGTVTPDDVRTFRRSRLRDRCIFCSHPLFDAQSLEARYGPECAKRYRLPYGQRHRAKVNVLIHQLAEARLGGDLHTVLRLINEISACGEYEKVVIDLRKNFGPDLQIRSLNHDLLMVKTPWLDPGTFDEWKRVCWSRGFKFNRDLMARIIPVNRLEEVKAALAEVEGFWGQVALGPRGELFVVGQVET